MLPEELSQGLYPVITVVLMLCFPLRVIHDQRPSPVTSVPLDWTFVAAVSNAMIAVPPCWLLSSTPSYRLYPQIDFASTSVQNSVLKSDFLFTFAQFSPTSAPK